MTRLIARSPAEGLTPVDAAGTTLIELPWAPMFTIAPYNGSEVAVSEALGALGLSLPGPGESRSAGEASILWFGLGTCLLIGAAPPDLPGAAVAEQSDGWARLRLDGPLAEAALARLVPLDLRASAFPEGATARSQLYHMALSITRTGPAAFDLMVFRSMAATAVHELTVAMRSVAAQH